MALKIVLVLGVVLVAICQAAVTPAGDDTVEISVGEKVANDLAAFEVQKLRSEFDGEVENVPTSTTKRPQFNIPVGVLPSPNGPFYGFLYDQSALAKTMLPFSVAGGCERGTVYKITNGDDLLKKFRSGELECVYSAGLPPQSVPQGTFYGKGLALVNSQLISTLIDTLWKGKMIENVTCRNSKTFVGFNNYDSRPVNPFTATIDTLEGINLAQGEYYDGKPSLILDHTEDFRQSCPGYRSFIEKNYNNAPIRRMNLIRAPYPLGQIIEAVRFVGVQEDGASIYLGKVYMQDAYREDRQAATIGYFYLTNYDKDAVPLGFRLIQSLLPLERSFTYIHPGITDLMFRILPFDNILTTPIRTIGTFIRGLFNSGRNSIVAGGEFSRNFNKMRANRGRFQSAFESDRKNARSQYNKENNVMIQIPTGIPQWQ